MNEKLSSLPSPYALTTDNTELVFVKKDALWRVAHYGERSNVAADAVLLTECRYNAESFGRATLETYPSFGADYGDNDGQMGMCKYGAIQAQHADGNTTIAYYYNGGKYYAYRTEVSANNYSYTAEVFDIYDSLSAFDGLEFSSVRLDKADKGAELMEARTEAVLDARAKAEAYAAAAGVRVGKVLSISETSSYAPAYRVSNMKLMAADAEAATEYYADDITVTSSVSKGYSIV